MSDYDYWCVVCEEPITGDDIEDRHTDEASGEDVHADCCLICCRNNTERCV